MTSKFFTVPAVVAGALGLTAVAQAAEPTVADLQQQIAKLQAQVGQMDQAGKNVAAARDVDATIESVLNDANDRSKLLAVEGVTAGHNGKNFVLSSADGNFVLMPKVLWQFRYVNNYITDDAKNGDGEFQDGFENRRLKISFEGNAISPDLKYVFRLSADRDGGDVGIDLAYITYKFADDLAVRVGQYKDQVHHEEIVSDGKQLAAERSLTNAILSGGQTDYVQGVALVYDNNDNLRGEIGFIDGYNSDNTNFQNGGGTAAVGITPPDFGVAGRVEFALSGGFAGYDQFTSLARKEDGLVLGAGFDWSQGGSDNVVFHAVDAQWNAGQLSVYGAYLGLYRDMNTLDDSFYDMGFLGQVGYLLNDQWEAFGRVGYMMLDEDALAAGSNDDIWEVTGGVNYYLKGHHAKITVDLTWLPEGSPLTSTGLGVLASDEDEFVFRGQFQLMI